MLDIGFTELLLIAVLALVVLGPERLPEAVRTTAFWINKIRRSFQNARSELEKELNVDELKRQIHNDAVMEELQKAKASLNESINTEPEQDHQHSAERTVPSDVNTSPESAQKHHE